MANPNLISVSSIYGKTHAAALGTGLASIPSGGMSVIPSFAFGLMGWAARTAEQSDKERQHEIFTRFLKEDKHIPANTHLDPDDPQYGVAEIKQWDKEAERIEKLKNLNLNTL